VQEKVERKDETLERGPSKGSSGRSMTEKKEKKEASSTNLFQKERRALLLFVKRRVVVGKEKDVGVPVVALGGFSIGRREDNYKYYTGGEKRGEAEALPEKALRNKSCKPFPKKEADTRKKECTTFILLPTLEDCPGGTHLPANKSHSPLFVNWRRKRTLEKSAWTDE